MPSLLVVLVIAYKAGRWYCMGRRRDRYEWTNTLEVPTLRLRGIAGGIPAVRGDDDAAEIHHGHCGKPCAALLLQKLWAHRLQQGNRHKTVPACRKGLKPNQ